MVKRGHEELGRKICVRGDDPACAFTDFTTLGAATFKACLH